MKQIIIPFLFYITISAACFAQVHSSLSKGNLTSNDSKRIEISTIMFSKNMITGTIHVDVPPKIECTIKIYPSSDPTIIFNSNQTRTFSLFQGNYDVEISGMILKNIPVYKAMDTRIRAGVLSVFAHSLWVLYHENKVKTIHISSLPEKLEFPIGIYQLKIKGLLRKIEIKDGGTLEYNDTSGKIIQTQKQNIADSNKNAKIKKLKTADLNKVDQPQKLKTNDLDKNKTIKLQAPNSLSEDKKWEIKKIQATKNGKGRIFINIPKEIECIISISQPATEKEVSYSGILTKERSFLLAPGTFNIKISGSVIKDVPVQQAMDTRIKAGVLNMISSGIWTLYNEKKSMQVYFSATPKKIGLPIGIYQIEIKGMMKQIIIKDGETVEFKN